MEYLIIFGLGVVLYQLWDRVGRLERRLQQFEDADAYRSTDRTAVLTQPQPATGRAPAKEPELAFRQSAEPEAVEQVELPEPEVEDRAEPAPVVDPAEEMPEPEQPDPEPSRFQPPKFDFEDIFGRKLPIWAGGIALAVGGVFLVIYAIEQGLLGPEVRVVLSFLFGLVLLGAAETAYRFEHKVRDPRVRQALAGAGIATLYASFYLAGAQYGLIGPAAAFGGLALVTAISLGLSFRFGLPAAVLGLVGGFATPMLVASEEANVPVLAFYLTLLTAGLALTGQRLGLRWLGAAALAGGLGWGVLMLVGQPIAHGDWIAIGLYLLVLGAAIPILVGNDARLPFTRLAAGALAALQMAALVGLAGYDLLTWGLYLLLAASLAALSWRAEDLRPANAFVAAVGIVLLATWPEPSGRQFALVAAALAAIALANPLAMLWRKPLDVLSGVQVAVAAPAIIAVTLYRFGIPENDVFQPLLAGCATLLGLFPALAAWRLWRIEEREDFLALPVAATAGLAFTGLHLLLPDWAEVTGSAIVALGVIELARRKLRGPLSVVAWLFALVTVGTLFSTGQASEELALLVGDPWGETALAQALVRWAAAATVFLALAWIERHQRAARVAEALLAFITYGLLAQFMPPDWLAWTAAVLALSCLWWRKQSSGFWWTTFAFAVLWSAMPMVTWLAEGWLALASEPMLAAGLPAWDDVLLHVLPATLVACLATWQMRTRKVLPVALGLAALLSGIAVDHMLYKQIFDLSSLDDFAVLGMAERTVWQALLAGVGVALARYGRHRLLQQAGTASLALGLAHFAVFTLGWHNPLWAVQAVGALPLANLLLPAYALAGVMVWWLAGQLPELHRERLRPLRDGLLMALISLWALSELRHAFAGTILIEPPLTQTEDLLRSLLGIVLALGFLWWGSRTGQRSWRIGSLVVMLLAVAKVFIVDAAVLEGLLRIASFLPLGASLIGIGWFYSRQLGTRSKAQ